MLVCGNFVYTIKIVLVTSLLSIQIMGHNIRTWPNLLFSCDCIRNKPSEFRFTLLYLVSIGYVLVYLLINWRQLVNQTKYKMKLNASPFVDCFELVHDSTSIDMIYSIYILRSFAASQSWCWLDSVLYMSRSSLSFNRLVIISHILYFVGQIGDTINFFHKIPLRRLENFGEQSNDNPILLIWSLRYIEANSKVLAVYSKPP